MNMIPSLRVGVVLIPVVDESVLYEQETGALHQLDHIATLVCGLFDGVSTIDDLAEVLAEGFGADHAVVRYDIMNLVQELERKGLLAGDNQPAPDEEI
jgi:hypothetical protein